MLPSDHILRKSKWIWPEAYMYLYNHYADFRRDFELKNVPQSAIMYITADKAYKLYINGQYVCRGPARGYQSHWPMDEVEIKDYLRCGKNYIAVEAYTPGISTFQYLHQTKAGFICAVDLGEFILTTDSTSWQMRRSAGRKSDVGRLSLQLDFQEHFDGRLEDQTWITSENAPTDWNYRKMLTPNGDGFFEVNFGTPPYDDVEPRNIPLLQEELIIPQKVTSCSTGKNYEGYTECKNVAWHYMEHELLPKDSWNFEVNWPVKVCSDGLEIEIPPCGKGKFQAVTVDLGKIYLGYSEVTITNAQGDEIIDFHYQQFLPEGYPCYMAPGAACMVAQSNRLYLPRGDFHHEFFHFIGQGAIIIQARDVTAPLKIKIALHSCGYPFTMRGTFDSSDALVNDIYECSRHTQKICSLDAYMDTPWREQAQWWGDARIQAKNTFFMDGDDRLLKRGIRSIAGQYAPQGLTYGHAPTSSGWCILPDFALIWIISNYDYYYQSGDISLFEEQHKRIKEVLSYFETKEVLNKDELIMYDSRFWLFEDWADLQKEDIPAFLNLLYIYALTHYEKLLKAAQLNDEAAEIAEKIKRRKTIVTKKFFDPQTGLFNGCLTHDYKVVGDPSVHDQVLAIELNLCPEYHENMIAKRILPYLNGDKIPGALPSAMWSTYVFNCARKHGLQQNILNFIKRKWEPMTHTKSTWECFDWDPASYLSCCHAWTAHPISEFVNVVVGLEQKDVQWRTVSFAPIFVENMEHASCMVPTPHGDLKAAWERKNGIIVCSLTLPQGIDALVKLPGMAERKVTGAGSYVFEVKK